MNNTAKWALGTAALSALATASFLMNKERIAKMGQEKMSHLEDAKNDITKGMKDAAKDLRSAMKM